MTVLSFVIIGCSQPSSQAGVVPNNANNQAEAKPVVVKKAEPFKFTAKEPAEGLQEKYSKYLNTRLAEGKKGQHFYIATQVFDPGFIFLSSLPDAYNKRYSDEKIKSNYQEIKRELNNDMMLNVVVAFQGNLYDNSELKFDENSREYFFLENEKGEYIQADKIDFGDNLLLNVGQLVPQLQFNLYFPAKDVEKMMSQSKQLFLSFKGLKIMSNEKDNRIELKYPFSEYYKNDFPVVAKMIDEMESYDR